MVIISIDLGTKCGIAVNIKGEVEFTEEYEFRGFMQLQAYVKYLMQLWRPDLVLVPYPTRFYNTILKHGKMMGVICAICEQLDVVMLEVQDKTCKKVVTGSGKATKDDIAEYYQTVHPEITSEHILDAILFCDWYLKAVEETAETL